MNYQGSYRKLLANSQSAIIASIEIYNKPRFEYRNEVFVQLLINGWELLLKAIVSRSRASIYYRKRRKDPAYRTLNWADAFQKAAGSRLWPSNIDAASVRENLTHLGVYRDSSVHFYNAEGFGAIVYSLAQTSITNYHDVLGAVFGRSLASEVTWDLLPLAINPSLSPLEYLSGGRPSGSQDHSSVTEFLTALSASASRLEANGNDTSRLMTVVDVIARSTKKIESADIVVGVQGEGGGSAQRPLLQTRRVDPNISHPHLRKTIMATLARNSNGAVTSPYVFQALEWKYKLSEDPKYCWVDQSIRMKKWSNEVVNFITRLSEADILGATDEYRRMLRRRRRTGKS